MVDPEINDTVKKVEAVVVLNVLADPLMTCVAVVESPVVPWLTSVNVPSQVADEPVVRTVKTISADHAIVVPVVGAVPRVKDRICPSEVVAAVP